MSSEEQCCRGYGGVVLWWCDAVVVWDCGAVMVRWCNVVVVWDCGGVGMWRGTEVLWFCLYAVLYGAVQLWCGGVALMWCGTVMVCDRGVGCL